MPQPPGELAIGRGNCKNSAVRRDDAQSEPGGYDRYLVVVRRGAAEEIPSMFAHVCPCLPERAQKTLSYRKIRKACGGDDGART